MAEDIRPEYIRFEIYIPTIYELYFPVFEA
jgi:hypothetical protein